MGRSVDIELNFESPISVDDILGELSNEGWGATSGGEIKYMSGDHDWNWANPENYGKVREEIRKTLEGGNSSAISLWGPEGHGINVLFFPGMEKLIVGPDLNRRPLRDAPELTDLGWYLSRLLPSFAKFGLNAVAARDEYPE